MVGQAVAFAVRPPGVLCPVVCFPDPVPPPVPPPPLVRLLVMLPALLRASFFFQDSFFSRGGLVRAGTDDSVSSRFGGRFCGIEDVGSVEGGGESWVMSGIAMSCMFAAGGGGCCTGLGGR